MKDKFCDGISVVIPIYNADKYIEDCLNSICHQTMTNLEIICVNDGSTDGSLAILHRLSSCDNRIKIIDIPNGGASHARNMGIELASKKYITFVDADDTIELDMYKVLYNMAEKMELDCVCCGFQVYPYKGKKRNVPVPFPNNTVFREYEIVENVVQRIIGFSKEPNDGLSSLCNKLFRTECIRQNNLIINEKRTHGEDWQFCIEFYAKCRSIGFISQCFYRYIHHSANSLVSRFRPNAFQLTIETEQLFQSLFPTLPWNSEMKQEELRMMPVKAALYYRQNTPPDTLSMGSMRRCCV